MKTFYFLTEIISSPQLPYVLHLGKVLGLKLQANFSFVIVALLVFIRKAHPWPILNLTMVHCLGQYKILEVTEEQLKIRFREPSISDGAA